MCMGHQLTSFKKPPHHFMCFMISKVQCVQALEQFAPTVTSMPASECEVLYGRAGFLFALLFVRKHVGPHAISSQTVAGLIQQILEAGAAGADAEPSLNHWGLMYQWHSSQYLGGCHGLAGQSTVWCTGSVTSICP